MRAWLQYLPVLAVSAALVGFGWWCGAGHAQAECQAAELARQRAQRTVEAAARRAMVVAAEGNEADRRQIRQQLLEAQRGLNRDLDQPLACGPAAPARLGDLPIPASLLERLRSAGADASTP